MISLRQDVFDADPALLSSASPDSKNFTLALCGNPNAGKTTLFNHLTGLRAQTANFPGTTIERKSGQMKLAGQTIDVVDLPGMYSLSAATPEEKIASDILMGTAKGIDRPDAVVVMADADNVERSLFLISQLVELDLPVVVALNMIDVAKRHGIHIDPEALSNDLGYPVVPMVARAGKGLEKLREEIARVLPSEQASRDFSFKNSQGCVSCGGCPFRAGYSWAEEVASRCRKARGKDQERRTEKIDRVLTHPVMGVVAFLSVILAVFYMIFSIATVPMDLIDGVFGRVGDFASRIIPAGDLQSLVVDGIIGGVGGILVFLPQICILFFFLALLEDSGYLARAAFVMDRLMRRVGLPGMSFVPLLSAHACAVPAIMSTRVIRNARDRLVTILIAPLMSCSARIPVYALITALLFPYNPVAAALTFTGAYTLGLFAALGVAFCFKKTILPGESKPMVLELPGYRLPSLRSSLLYTFDRAKVFIQQAGTIILLISIVLWALATYPKSEQPAEAVALLQQAERLTAQGNVAQASELQSQAQKLTARHALSNSAAGRLGKFIEPVVRPLGFDWQIGIGIISSFAAREVIVSTLSIVYGLGEEAGDEGPAGLVDTLRKAQRQDGTAVFSLATCVSLLVFYVLAMQCLPTQAITKRETNSWKWPIFQLVYMSLLAYGAAFMAYQLVQFFSA